MLAMTLEKGWKLLGGLALGTLLAAVATPRATAVDTPLSGFNGDLTSSVGASWEMSLAGWSGEFVAPLSEGSSALRVYHNPAWEYGLKLSGGVQLAQLVANNDTFEFDAVTPYGINWRNFEVIMNNNVNGWHQTGGIAISYPTELAPFQHFTLNLASVNGSNWKQDAQAWLDAPRTNPEWFELFFVLQGAENAYSADFEPDNDVDGEDYLVWQKNYGHDFAGPAEGDATLDLLVNDDDFVQWNEQFGRRSIDPYTMLDNLKFVDNTPVASIPEPASLVSGLVGAALAMGAAARRGRVS